MKMQRHEYLKKKRDREVREEDDYNKGATFREFPYKLHVYGHAFILTVPKVTPLAP